MSDQLQPSENPVSTAIMVAAHIVSITTLEDSKEETLVKRGHAIGKIASAILKELDEYQTYFRISK